MQSLKKIMQEMGFNKDSSPETQKAFIKHLLMSAGQTKAPIRAAASAEVRVEEKIQTKVEAPITKKQLEFDWKILDMEINENPKNKKRVS